MLARLREHLKAQNIGLRAEVLGGLTTFATMAYIIVVNPSILGEAMGRQWTGALVVATCISSAVPTALMGWWARYPIALAPGMGLNAYFAYTVVLQQHIPWPVALAAVFLSGLLFILLALVNVQEMLVTAIPAGIRHGIAAGIGIFIAFIGLENAHIVVANPGTLVTAGDLARPESLLALGGIVLIGGLRLWGVRAAIIIGIVAIAVVGMAIGISPLPGAFAAAPVWSTGLIGQAVVHLSDALDLGLVTIVVTFLFIDLLDTAGTLTGVGGAAGLLDAQGRLPRARRAFLAGGVGTSFGALMGTSTVTSYIESAAGISEGARTGIANYVTAALFLLAIPFYPLAQAIPPYATAPALVVVGVMMCAQMRNVRWDDMGEALPAVAAMIGIPLTFSIATGLAIAFVIHPLLLAAGGRWRQVHWLSWLLAALVILRYALMSGGA